MRPRIAGRRHRAERAAAVDARTLQSRIAVGQQPAGRDADERGIADVGLAVGEREVQSARDRMDVWRRVVAEGREARALEDLERLEERDALTPRVAGVDGEPSILTGDALLELRLVDGEARLSEEAALLDVVGVDRLGARAAIAVVVRRPERRLPVGPPAA